jgi:hypothetical protein
MTFSTARINEKYIRSLRRKIRREPKNGKTQDLHTLKDNVKLD